MIHELKTTSKFFRRVFDNDKQFEVRKNDRDFQINDTLKLIEIDDNNEKTGRTLYKRVRYILSHIDYPDGLKEGYCVLGLSDT